MSFKPICMPFVINYAIRASIEYEHIKEYVRIAQLDETKWIELIRTTELSPYEAYQKILKEMNTDGN